MAVKTVGRAWKSFYSDPEFWPAGAWHDDEIVTIDGKQADSSTDIGRVEDASKIVIVGGIVFVNEGAVDGPSLEAYFRQWRKKQNTVVLVVEVPREKEAALRAAVRGAGARVCT
jgi:hypothetical protein